MYDQLTALLQGRQSLDTKSSITVDPIGAAYPKLCFWMQIKYNKWTNSPEAHSHTHWKTPFLEDINAVTVSKDTIKAIQKAMCAGWIELVDKGMVPKS